MHVSNEDRCDGLTTVVTKGEIISQILPLSILYFNPQNVTRRGTQNNVSVTPRWYGSTSRFRKNSGGFLWDAGNSSVRGKEVGVGDC